LVIVILITSSVSFDSYSYFITVNFQIIYLHHMRDESVDESRYRMWILSVHIKFSLSFHIVTVAYEIFYRE